MATRKPKPGTVTEAGIVKITGPFSASFSLSSSFIFSSASTDAYADKRAIAVTGLGLAKMKRADGNPIGSAAGCLAQNFQWRQATRKTVATKRDGEPEAEIGGCVHRGWSFFDKRLAGFADLLFFTNGFEGPSIRV